MPTQTPALAGIAACMDIAACRDIAAKLDTANRLLSKPTLTTSKELGNKLAKQERTYEQRKL
jgi:hypothetical protein